MLNIKDILLLSLYYRLTFILKKKHLLYWSLISILFLFSYICIVALARAKHFWLSELYFTFLCCGIPTFELYYIKYYAKLTKNLVPMFRTKDFDFISWAHKNALIIFSIKKIPMWITSLSINLLGTFSIVKSGLPFESTIANISLLVGMEIVFFFCGQAAYYLATTMLYTYKLARLQLNISFGDNYQYIISKLSKYLYFHSIFVLISYIGLFFAVRFSPFINSVFMTPWLIILALTPIVFFMWSIYQIHTLMKRIKYVHCNVISKEVKRLFLEYQRNSTTENIDRFYKGWEILKDVHQIQEWPISLQTFVTFVLTVIVATAQIIVAISNIIK